MAIQLATEDTALDPMGNTLFGLVAGPNALSGT